MRLGRVGTLLFKRILITIPILFGVITITFFATRLAGGDPAYLIAGAFHNPGGHRDDSGPDRHRQADPGAVLDIPRARSRARLGRRELEVQRRLGELRDHVWEQVEARRGPDGEAFSQIGVSRYEFNDKGQLQATTGFHLFPGMIAKFAESSLDL